jgi:ribosomal protein L7/L12
MRTFIYEKSLGEIRLSSLTYNIAKALCEDNPELARDLILSQHDLTPWEAKEVVLAMVAMPDHPYTYSVSWSAKAYLQITEAEWSIINSLYRQPVPLKVTAIKFLKEQHGLRLKEAKDICDEIGTQKV